MVMMMVSGGHDEWRVPGGSQNDVRPPRHGCTGVRHAKGSASHVCAAHCRAYLYPGHVRHTAVVLICTLAMCGTLQ